MPACRYVDALDGSTLQACHDLPINLNLHTAHKATSVQGATDGDPRHESSVPSLRRCGTSKYLSAVHAKPKAGKYSHPYSGVGARDADGDAVEDQLQPE